MPAANLPSETVSRIRSAADRVRAAHEYADDVLSEVAALGTLDQIQDSGDPMFQSGAHQGLTKAELSNALFALSTFAAFYDTHKTNLQSVRT